MTEGVKKDDALKFIPKINPRFSSQTGLHGTRDNKARLCVQSAGWRIWEGVRRKSVRGDGSGDVWVFQG